MGQSPSTAIFQLDPPSPAPVIMLPEQSQLSDFTYALPDECLARVFQTLGAGDRKSCSLVCRRWKVIEGQTRHRLSLNAQSELHHAIPSLFSRFDSVTKLSLKCDRRSISINDEDLVLISVYYTRLTRLKLRACREITDAGVARFAMNCKTLKKLSIGSCGFGAKGVKAVLDSCAGLEELSVKRLRGLADGTNAGLIGPPAGSALRVVCLKELHNGQCFGPLLTGSKNLRTLKIIKCSGNWDGVLQQMTEKVASGVVEVHLERVQVSDIGLSTIANCANLEILHLLKTPECTNSGLMTVSETCRLIRKLHIDGWKANRIGDQGLISIAKNLPNLQELVLIGTNPTSLSLEMLATNCQHLERLALCGIETVGDSELSTIATKFMALKKLCIKNCPVSNHGIEALAFGCPNLVKLKVKKCRAVTCEGVNWLRAKRGSLDVNFDTGEVERTSASDVVQNVGEFNANANMVDGNDSLRRTARSNSVKARLSLFSGRNFVACTLRRWSSTNFGNK